MFVSFCGDIGDIGDIGNISISFINKALETVCIHMKRINKWINNYIPAIFVSYDKEDSECKSTVVAREIRDVIDLVIFHIEDVRGVSRSGVLEVVGVNSNIYR